MDGRPKIGVFGSAANATDEIKKAAKKLGIALGTHDCIVITGACSGLPYVAAKAAHDHGAEVWGFSPKLNIEGQKLFTPDDDLSIYSRIEYVDFSLPFANDDNVNKKYRNVLSTAAVDAGIIISGRWGTMNEFTNLFDMGKVIGVFIGTGGIADELLELSKKIAKPSEAQVLFNNSAETIVSEVFAALKHI